MITKIIQTVLLGKEFVDLNSALVSNGPIPASVSTGFLQRYMSDMMPVRTDMKDIHTDSRKKVLEWISRVELELVVRGSRKNS